MVGGLTWGCPGLFVQPPGGADNLLLMVVPVSMAGNTQPALHGAIELRPENEALAHSIGGHATFAEAPTRARSCWRNCAADNAMAKSCGQAAQRCLVG
jgi:hypothetical protein